METEIRKIDNLTEENTEKKEEMPEGKRYIIPTNLSKSPDKIVIHNDSNYTFSPFSAKVYFEDRPACFVNLTGVIKPHTEDSLGEFSNNYIHSLLEPFYSGFDRKSKPVNVEFVLPQDVEFTAQISHHDLHIRIFNKIAPEATYYKVTN